MESISCYITSLVINSLGDRDTHTHTTTDICTETILIKQSHAIQTPIATYIYVAATYVSIT